jgi:RNA polymerase sigma-70 factor (ECF subfamily)
MMRTEFETAVAQHQRRVFTVAYYSLASREEAEDVTQEVFLKLWSHRRQVLASPTLGAWLVRVARNACIDRARHRKTVSAVLQPVGESPPPSPSLDPDPERLARSAELRSHLERALARLPEPQRSIAILREIEALPYSEIAEALELPLNTVKAYLHRARRRLRSELREVADHAQAC